MNKTSNSLILLFVILIFTACTTKPEPRYLCLAMGWDVTGYDGYIKASEISEQDRFWIDSLRIGAQRRNPKDSYSEEVYDSILIHNSEKRSKFFSCDIFIKYNQIVNGYEVKVGNVGDSCVWILRNTETGNTIYHRDYGFSIFFQELCISTEQIEEEYHLFYLDYKERIPEENDGYFIQDKSFFQFADVDFDGEDEILFSLFTCNQEGDLYKTYDIVDDSLILLDYLPFNRFFSRRARMFPEEKEIRLFENAGCSYGSTLVFSKRETYVKNDQNFPDIELMPSNCTVKEYAKLPMVQLTLDSIFYCYQTDDYDVYQTDTFTFCYENDILQIANCN